MVIILPNRIVDGIERVAKIPQAILDRYHRGCHKIIVVKDFVLSGGRIDRIAKIPQAILDRYHKIAAAMDAEEQFEFAEAAEIYFQLGMKKRAADLYIREGDRPSRCEKQCDLYEKAAALYRELGLNDKVAECTTNIKTLIPGPREYNMTTKTKTQKTGIVDAIRLRVRRGDGIPQAFLDKYLQREDVDKRDKIAVAEVFKAGKKYVEAGDIYACIGYVKRAADLYFREAERELHEANDGKFNYDKGCELYKKAAKFYTKVGMKEKINECIDGIDKLAARTRRIVEFVADSESGLGSYLEDRLEEIDQTTACHRLDILRDFKEPLP